MHVNLWPASQMFTVLAVLAARVPGRNDASRPDNLSAYRQVSACTRSADWRGHSTDNKVGVVLDSYIRVHLLRIRWTGLRVKLPFCTTERLLQFGLTGTDVAELTGDVGRRKLSQ